MELGVTLDVVVIAMLGATIFYALKLERRLASLRGAQEALAGAVHELNTAADRAQSSIQGLKNEAAASGQSLDDKIKNARNLAGELESLLRSGERLGRIGSARSQQVTTRSPSGAEMLRALGGAR
jgi:chromosome segregation ATPase